MIKKKNRYTYIHIEVCYICFNI